MYISPPYVFIEAEDKVVLTDQATVAIKDRKFLETRASIDSDSPEKLRQLASLLNSLADALEARQKAEAAEKEEAANA